MLARTLRERAHENVRSRQLEADLPASGPTPITSIPDAVMADVVAAVQLEVVFADGAQKDDDAR